MMKSQRLRGFSLIEILMVLALIAILLVGSVIPLETISNQVSYDKTYEEMLLIRTAIIGDLDATTQGHRAGFGYLGDLGALPANLNALIAQPSGTSAFAINSTAKIGIGWRGPYLKATTGTDWTTDGWGRAYVYSTSGTPSLTSYGADGTSGGSDAAADITFALDTTKTTATVFGTINQNGKVFNSTALVTMYYPNGSGGLTTVTDNVAVGEFGTFSFANVPFGVRSLKVDIPAASPTQTIGPVLLRVDRERYWIAPNFLDASPGTITHPCEFANMNVSYISGTFKNDTTTDRIYFAVSTTTSIFMDSFYFSNSHNRYLKRFKLGDIMRECDGSTLHFRNCPNSGHDYLDPDDAPEAALQTGDSFIIPQATRLEGYVQLNDSSSVTWVDLRLGCNLIRIQ